MEKTGFVRKLDSTGRLVIPTKLRDQMGLVVGEEYSFYTHETNDGRRFICIECPEVDTDAIEEAKRILEKFGYTVQ